MKHGQNNRIPEKSVAYIHGRIEHELEGFAASLEVPTSELTSRVGALLLGQASGEIPGTEDRMPPLRRTPTKRSKGSRKMAMARGSHRDTSKRKSKTSRAQSAYWAAMTPEQRRREVQRRMKKRNKTLSAAA